jgi:hypothetical protein
MRIQSQFPHIWLSEDRQEKNVECAVKTPIAHHRNGIKLQRTNRKTTGASQESIRSQSRFE